MSIAPPVGVLHATELRQPPAPARRAPAGPGPERGGPRPGRDVPLDLLRGLAMAILVVNHTKLESVLTATATSALSAAEALVAISGVVVGMVFGRRWRTDARATTALLLRRAGKLHVASIAVVAGTLALTAVPGLATDALTLRPASSPPVDLYAHDEPWRMAWAVVTLEAGPWQFNILGFFIASLVLTPGLLWLLSRGRWPMVLATSWLLWALAREWQPQVLLSQSEFSFPLLVWQVLYVHGLALGYHRRALEPHLRRLPRAAIGCIVVLGLTAGALRIGGPMLPPDVGWAAWRDEHFYKRLLDPLRLLGMVSLTVVTYLALRRHAEWAERRLGWLLLPLGRHSFYVFIVHVPLMLALASIPALADGNGLGPVGNTAVQVACVLLICGMVRRRILFRLIPS